MKVLDRTQMGILGLAGTFRMLDFVRWVVLDSNAQVSSPALDPICRTQVDRVRRMVRRSS